MSSNMRWCLWPWLESQAFLFTFAFCRDALLELLNTLLVYLSLLLLGLVLCQLADFPQKNFFHWFELLRVGSLFGRGFPLDLEL